MTAPVPSLAASTRARRRRSADVVEAVRLLLKLEGYEVDGVGSPGAVLAAVEGRQYDVALIDLNYARDTTSGLEGLDLLTRLRQVDQTLPVVVMTAWGTVDIAVEAMRAAPATSSRSRGRTRGCSRCCVPRSSWVGRCAARAGSRPRTRCCARPRPPPWWPRRRPCSRCCRCSRASGRRTRTS